MRYRAMDILFMPEKMSVVRNLYRFVKRYYLDNKASRPYSVKLFNYQWHTRHVPDHWLYQFIVNRNILKSSPNKTISIFSVNGSRKAIGLNRSNYKIFYTAENVHVPDSHWQKYEDLLLNIQAIDLSLGFDYIEHNQYLRFPLWLMYIFRPDDTYKDIKDRCKLISQQKIDLDERNRFCTLICKHDYFGYRKVAYEVISKVGNIDCPSNFMHNNDDLKKIFKDNKFEYLKQYKFNLCPENTNNKGYVTEKVFEAISSGCIPIYWGSENNPEPEILNHQAILFYNNTDDNTALVHEIERLKRNSKLYRKFAEQNRLLDSAHDIIYCTFQKLENKLREIVNR